MVGTERDINYIFPKKLTDFSQVLTNWQFTQNKLALKLIQDFFPHFGSAVR